MKSVFISLSAVVVLLISTASYLSSTGVRPAFRLGSRMGSSPYRPFLGGPIRPSSFRSPTFSSGPGHFFPKFSPPRIPRVRRLKLKEKTKKRIRDVQQKVDRVLEQGEGPRKAKRAKDYGKEFTSMTEQKTFYSKMKRAMYGIYGLVTKWLK